MAHKLSFQKNAQVGDFVYVNEKPWHELGTMVQNIGFNEAIEQGGLGYHVEKAPNHHIITGQEPIVSSESFFTYRTDTNKILGPHVGNRYTVLQNTEALEIVTQFSDYQIETAGVLMDGAVAFVCMKTTEKVVVGKDDVTELYLLFVNGHNGQQTTSIIFTPIRVVCNNTLTAALHRKVRKYTFRHTTNVREKLGEFAKVQNLIKSNMADFAVNANLMIGNKIQIVDYLANVFLTADEIGEVKNGNNDILSTRKKNQIITALQYAERGPGQDGLMGTGWGGFNTVTGYLGGKEFDGVDDAMLSTVFGLGYEKMTDHAAALATGQTKMIKLPAMETILFG